MSGFDGRISFDGDSDVAAELTDLAIKQADKLRAWKQTSGVRNLVRTVSLKDGYYAVVTDLEHMRAIRIHAPTDSIIKAYADKLPSLDEYRTLGVITPLCGFVKVGGMKWENLEITTTDGSTSTTKTIRERYIFDFTPTTKSANRFTEQEARRRLSMLPNDKLAGTGDPEKSVRPTQIGSVTPGLYSGAMREVVQLLLGVGRILRPTYEEKWLAKDKTRKALLVENKSLLKSPYGLSGLSQSPIYEYFGTSQSERPNDEQVYPKNPDMEQEVINDPKLRLEFDWHFAKTHGITFGPSGKPFVIEISNRGVHAMPLYMDPVSLTEKGRERYLELCPELENFFNKFGGFPIGAAPPSGELFSTLKKAGEITELLAADDMKDFYENGFFWEDSGWSFNSNGTAACNTCNGYENGIQTGELHRVSLKIDSIVDLPEWTDDMHIIATKLGLTKFYELNKVRRLLSSDISTLLSMLKASSPDYEAIKKEFDDMDASSGLKGSAEIVRMRKGFLWYPGKFRGFPQIKFHSRYWNGLVSWDFSAVEGATIPPGIRCDTPMYAAYIGDNLEVINFYYTTRPQAVSTSEYTRGECQYVGKWVENYYMNPGQTRVAGHFYSTSIDQREVVNFSDSVFRTTNGKQLATYTWCSSPPFATCLTCAKWRSFQYVTVTKWTRSANAGTFAAVPMYERNTYYMAKGWQVTLDEVTESTSTYDRPFGKIYTYGIYNRIFHWYPCAWLRCEGYEFCIAQHCPDLDGMIGGLDPNDPCYPDDVPEEPNYSCCTIDNTTMSSAAWGTEIGGGQFPEYYAPSSLSRILVPGGYHYKQEVRAVTDVGTFRTKSFDVTVTASSQYDPAKHISSWWGAPSPDENGMVPYLFVTRSFLGGDIMNYSDDLNGSSLYTGSPDSMRDGGTYIGVIT